MAMKLLAALCMVAMTIAPSSALTTEEVQVFNDVTRTKGTLTITDSGNYHNIQSKGIPEHDVGTFPGNNNPNSIKEQSFNFNIPKTPTVASEPECLPMGPIGITVSGAVFYSPYTDEVRDAVEGEYAETFDDCQGHPDVQGIYHYHQTPGCIVVEGQKDQFIGVAMDGYAIYSNTDANGTEISSNDLDDCNGRTVNGVYRYHLTKAFPYMMGCFHGTPNYANPSNRCYFAKRTSGSSRLVSSFAGVVTIFLLAAIFS